MINGKIIRVVVAEDSPTARMLIVAMLESDPDITVVGQARTGAEAVTMVEQLAPDLVTMDVQMPELDGLEATKRIMNRSPRPIIIVSSQAREREVALSLEAMRAGALLVLAKPEGAQSAAFEGDRRQLVSMVKAMAQVKVVRRWGARESSDGAPQLTLPQTTRSAGLVRLVAIAASTGGPAALRDILSALPAQFPVPILVVQHIAKGFVAGLAQWLNASSHLSVKVAEDGEVARRGSVYVAAEDQHLGVTAVGKELRIALSRGDPIGSFRPSATAMFQSVASLGKGVLAVILTGMGDDGVAGLRAVRASGGHVLAQDEASSVIYGMPREAIRAGVADAVVPLLEMPRRMVEAVA